MQLPTPRVIDQMHVQVYFATRVNGKSHIGYCILQFDEASSEFYVVSVFENFCQSPGPTGSYSQDGIHPSSIIEVDGRILMYTIGWIEGASRPLFSASIGLSESNDGFLYEDRFHAPILDRGEHDITLVTSPCVVQGYDSPYEMFYTSGTGWVSDSIGGYDSRYHIKKAYSDDGLAWIRKGEVVIDYTSTITNVARPAYFTDGEVKSLLFSFNDSRLKRYSLGIARLDQGSWKIEDPLHRLGEFDKNECAAYPAVFSLGPRNFLLINGIDRGKSGFSVYEL